MCRSDQCPARVGLGEGGFRQAGRHTPGDQEEAQQEEQGVSVLVVSRQLCWMPGLI